MPRPRCKPWPPDPNQTASGKPGAVQPPERSRSSPDPLSTTQPGPPTSRPLAPVNQTDGWQDRLSLPTRAGCDPVGRLDMGWMSGRGGRRSSCPGRTRRICARGYSQTVRRAWAARPRRGAKAGPHAGGRRPVVAAGTEDALHELATGPTTGDDATLAEQAELYEARTGRGLSAAALCRAFRRHGLKREKGAARRRARPGGDPGRAGGVRRPGAGPRPAPAGVRR